MRLSVSYLGLRYHRSLSLCCPRGGGGVKLQRRGFSWLQPCRADPDRTRNIGIIAHIDAGKTTTTERMLYYSGHTRRIGDVDEGSTVTDFLPAERARGITIQSAAISFNWPPRIATSHDVLQRQKSLPLSSVSHNINLIDTPGHADFTFEVLRSLRVLDGAVCILDGVAGVEAQTEKVWHQASRYAIPRIVYVNKLDREGAAFNRTIKEIGTRLHGWPAVCAIPWWRKGDRRICGTGDVIRLLGLRWQEGSDGRNIEATSLDDLDGLDPELATELRRARVALVEILSEHDDAMVEKYLDCNEDHLAIPAHDITSSLRRCVLSQPQIVVPVFAGASFRNMGVQPLMDAVVDLLPAPVERPDPEISIAESKATLAQLLQGKLNVEQTISTVPKKPFKKPKTSAETALQDLNGCALAFKVVNDAKRGVLVYIRVYSGSIMRGSNLWNTNLNLSERGMRLLKMYASEAVEVDSIDAGQIGVIVGLKHARTGDTLISHAKSHANTGPPAPLNSLQLRPIEVPPPVFWTSVEPNSLSEERNIDNILRILLREDPSLSVIDDPESGQKQLAGMGELHLEIARDRLVQDFKAKAHIGKIEISYRETIVAPSGPHLLEINQDVAGKHAHASCVVSAAPTKDGPILDDGNGDVSEITGLSDNLRLTIHHPGFDTSGSKIQEDYPDLPTQLSFANLLNALTNGATAAFARGPAYRFPMHSTHVTVTIDAKAHITPDTTPAALSLAVRQAIQTALKAAGSALMEPVMHVSISVNERAMGAVVHDLTSARGAHILSLDDHDGDDGQQQQQQDSAIAHEHHLLPAIDPRRIYAPPDPFSAAAAPRGSDSSSNAEILNPVVTPDPTRQITARVPLREMLGYLRHLRSLTGGKGTFVMQVDRFERVAGPRLKGILADLGVG